MTTKRNTRAYDEDGAARQLSPQQLSAIDLDAISRAAPWTKSELERVRNAALALVRTHAPGGKGGVTVGGRELWALMGALDRTSEPPNRR